MKYRVTVEMLTPIEGSKYPNVDKIFEQTIEEEVSPVGAIARLLNPLPGINA